MSNTEEEDRGTPSVIEAMSSGLPNESSLLDALSQQVQESTDTRDTYVPVFTAREKDYTLMAHYRLLDGKELERIAKKIQRDYKKTFDRNLYGSLDVMIESCIGFAVDLGDGEKKPLTLNGNPISGYDMDLARALKFESKVNENDARTIASALFGGNVVAIQTHNLLLGRWMSDTTVDTIAEYMDAKGNR